MLGLPWEDVDLDAGALRVRLARKRIESRPTLKVPKTEKSRGALRVPASFVAALRAHRDRHAFERAAAGARWQDA